ncbi:MAG TPA: lysylphosphatidylglycerol synthase transmembrane domain-containing protein [Polyangiaceae bacterium]|nr:lysylphosphatidylglycerol synthase transmembrane domain-containing protein [Polyangiaceae bacterium]
MSAEPVSKPPPSLLRRAAPRVVLSLLIAAGFVWLLKRGGLPFAPPAQGMQELRWWGLPAFGALALVAAALRTWRWIYLLRPMAPSLRPWRVFGIGLVGFSAVFFAPLRLGEVVRPYLMSREGEVTFVQAVGTVAAERIIDGLVLVLMTAAALAMSTPLSPLPNRVGSLPIPVSLVPHTIVLATAVFSLAFAAMALFYFARRPAQRLSRAVLGVISARLADFGAGTVERLAESFGFLPSWQRSAPFLRNTLLYWLVNGCAHYALLRGVGLPATLPQAFVTMGVIGLGSLLPAGPGMFGAFQVATYTSLAMFNSEHDVLTKGAVAVFGSYLVQLTLNALQGAAGSVLLARLPRTTSS